MPLPAPTYFRAPTHFWNYYEVSNSVELANALYVIDIDGDGDNDVVSDKFDNSGKVFWHENLDGSGRSWTRNTIAYDQAKVSAIDLDGDGDVDVLSASLKNNQIDWHENLDGSGGSWSTHTIYSGGSSARAVSAIDVDGDGDCGVITGSYGSARQATPPWWLTPTPRARLEWP